MNSSAHQDAGRVVGQFRPAGRSAASDVTAATASASACEQLARRSSRFMAGYLGAARRTRHDSRRRTRAASSTFHLLPAGRKKVIGHPIAGFRQRPEAGPPALQFHLVPRRRRREVRTTGVRHKRPPARHSVRRRDPSGTSCEPSCRGRARRRRPFSKPQESSGTLFTPIS